MQVLGRNTHLAPDSLGIAHHNSLLLSVGVGSPPAAAQVFCAEVTRADRFYSFLAPRCAPPSTFLLEMHQPLPRTWRGPGDTLGPPPQFP